MATVYETCLIDAPKVSPRPMTMVVITWPNAQDGRPGAPEAELSGSIDLHAEDEPTWEDAAWV